MNYVFLGTPRFAAILLEELIKAGVPPLAIVASPDRPAGRKKELTPPATKLISQKYDLPIYQPERLTKQELLPLAKQADFFLVAAYAKIIPLEILRLPRLGTLGLHPSLLPYFRGASPIQSAILSGTLETGVTIYQLDDKIDHGPIISAMNLENYKPDECDYNTLEKRLARLGAKLFLETLPEFIKGNLSPKKQDETAATITTKFKTSDAKINESDLRSALSGEKPEIARTVLRKILAFSQEPGAWTILEKPLPWEDQILPPARRIKLIKGRLEKDRLHLQAIQIEGKKPQNMAMGPERGFLT
jgi:methionyl-tRNA formyltransferase